MSKHHIEIQDKDGRGVALLPAISDKTLARSLAIFFAENMKTGFTVLIDDLSLPTDTKITPAQYAGIFGD
jgi:hypothetical protein